MKGWGKGSGLAVRVRVRVSVRDSVSGWGCKKDGTFNKGRFKVRVRVKYEV